MNIIYFFNIESMKSDRTFILQAKMKVSSKYFPNLFIKNSAKAKNILNCDQAKVCESLQKYPKINRFL